MSATVPSRLIRRSALVLLVAFGASIAGCENAPPSHERGAAARPGDATPDREAPRAMPPATRPTTTAPSPPAKPLPTRAAAPPSATSQPARPGSDVAAPPPPAPPAPPQPPAPPPPDYIHVLARFKDEAPVSVRADADGTQQLSVQTDNVRRLRIDRDHVPLDRTKSIALLLDGQPYEWLARSKVAEFERSTNGRWAPVKETRP